ncbi:MAG: transcription antitermination factor NusB [Hyphomicrobiaceae bacterium]
MSGEPAITVPPLAPRSAARVAAVQALYQMDLAATDLNEVIGEFEAFRFGPDAEDRTVADADRDFFRSLIQGVVRRQREIDPMIDRQLAEGWRLTRIDSILRAILRVGALELLERSDVPARVVITEYVNTAHAFLGGDEPRVVNGVLDKLARRQRPTEFT